MSNYSRFVSYLYEYKNGAKSENRGFIKVESRDNVVKIEIHIKSPSQAANLPLTIYGFAQQGRHELPGILLGNCTTGRGSTNHKLRLPLHGIENTNYNFQDLSGLLIFGENNLCYGTSWDDNPINVGNFHALQPVVLSQTDTSHNTSYPAEQMMPAIELSAAMVPTAQAEEIDQTIAASVPLEPNPAADEFLYTEVPFGQTEMFMDGIAAQAAAPGMNPYPPMEESFNDELLQEQMNPYSDQIPYDYDLEGLNSKKYTSSKATYQPNKYPSGKTATGSAVPQPNPYPSDKGYYDHYTPKNQSKNQTPSPIGNAAPKTSSEQIIQEPPENLPEHRTPPPKEPSVGSKTRQPSEAPVRHTVPQPSPAPARHTAPQPSPAPARHTAPQPGPASTRHTAPQPSPAPVKHTAPQPPQPSPAPVKHTAPQSSPAPVRHTAPQPNQAPIRHTAPQPNQAPVRHTAPQPNQAPVRHTAPQPNQAPVRHTAPQPSQAPARHTTPQPSQAPTRHTTPQPSPTPAEYTIHQPSQAPAGHTIHQPSQAPAGHTIHQPSQAPAGYRIRQVPAEHTTRQPSQTPCGYMSAPPCQMPSGRRGHQPFQAPSGYRNQQSCQMPSGHRTHQPCQTPGEHMTHPPAVEAMPIASTERWLILQKDYQTIHVFPDDEIVECIRVEQKDLPQLRRENWLVGSNQFIIHAFANYKHLIMGRMNNTTEPVYILGVPGVYDPKEKFMANMFGFPYFKLSSERSRGNFGYWYRAID